MYFNQDFKKYPKQDNIIKQIINNFFLTVLKKLRNVTIHIV